MASGDLSLSSNSSQEESADYVGFGADRALRPSSNSSGSIAANLANNNSNKKYDIEKYKQAMLELRRQHSDTVRRCEEMASQLSFYQEQYMAAMNQLETSSKDRTKFSDLAAENACLKQRNVYLDKQLRRIMTGSFKQENDNGNSQSSISFYGEQYGELPPIPIPNKCDGECMENEKLLEEIQMYKKLYSDLSKERNVLSAERDKLRMQLSTAVNDLDNAKREKNIYKDNRDRLILQRDQQDKKIMELKNVIAAKDNELLMTQIHRNRVTEELNQILSEKDNVLQETQKMSDDLSAVKKDLDAIEMQKKKDELKYKSEIKVLQQANTDLLRNLEELKVKLEQRDLLKSRESSWSKEFSESKDDFKEIEKLRKSLEKARSEAEKASQETELAKSRRDWAISEREKIVQERDSVKTLCDNLRKERDNKTTDLLSAIIDSENIKKQLDESQREIEGLKEQLENKVIDSRRSIRWSSFDVDDVLEIELGNFHHDADIGIILDDSNNRQLVCGVTNTSPAFGKLKINDVIVKVNNLDCESMTKRIVLEEIRASAPRCTLLVCRTKQSKRHMYTVHLNLQNNHSHGISLDTGFFISKIEQNSLASFEPELDIGDRVLSINNKSMGVQSVKDVMKILDDPRNDSITIIALKNVQDISYPEVHRRVTNTSAQTDSNDSMHKTTSSKHPSKISEMINRFREKIHITKSVGDTDNFSQENDALAALDSVLIENSEKSKENLFKRSKKSKKDKEASKSMGTWPRAAILNAAQENSTGTIVQHRKKERAALSLFTAAPINVDKEEDTGKLPNNGSSASFSSKNNPNRNSNPIPASLFQSNPSNGYLHRHSMYGAPIETEPIVLQNKTIQRGSQLNANLRRPDVNQSKYGNNQRQHHYQNRFSLNLTPLDSSLMYKSTGQTAQQQVVVGGGGQQPNLDFNIKKQQIMDNMMKTPFYVQPAFSTGSPQQNSLDVISLKSQNSIDSFLSQKSPPIHDYHVNYPKRPVPSRNVLKYPSDSESIAMDSLGTSGPPSSTGPTSMLFNSTIGGSSSSSSHRHAPLFPSFPPNLIHPHPHKIRQQSPLTLPASSHSIEHSMTGPPPIGIPDKFDVDFSTPSHPQAHHAYNASVDYPGYNRSRQQPQRDLDDAPTSYQHVYEGGTFPRKKEHQRWRIPSNPSMTSKGSGVKNSTGSIDHHGSERGSPMPPVHVEILSHGANKRNSNVPDFLYPGDLRRVTIDKSDKPLGITIQCNNNGGGIFVSAVAERSIVSRAGLQVGDQLLEVCGINMRSATKDIAANVLRQCGNSITMLVQYNPEKYDSGTATLEAETVNHSGSPTPRNSPRPPTRSLILPSPPTSSTALTSTNTLPQSSLISTPIKNQKFADSLENQSDSSNRDSSGSIYEEDTRYISIQTDKCKNLGIKLCGGNKVGIFVNEVKRDSPAGIAGIRVGDQILEYNGVDFRRITAEQAANMLSKLPDGVRMLVQNQLQKLNEIQDKTGDSFYIRVGFDRTGDLQKDELRFTKDEVLYVDSTIVNGEFGQWRAWKLDGYGHRKECGVIPSQLKVEEELRLLGDSVDCDSGTTRRGSTSARRSFFRRKKHQRSSSRDSKELASFSNTQLSYFSDSGMLHDDGGLLSYQRVERLDYPVCRPVLVLGPLSEIVTNRLTIDFPMIFQPCKLTLMDCSQEAMEEGLMKNIFVDYRRKGNKFECTAVESVRSVAKNNRHCILDVSISAVERLQRQQIYPIVLLLRFKSAKQIKEVKDSCCTTDKNSAKAAKEMYERALKLESDYKQYISAVIPAGVNITHMSTQIKASVDDEQSRILWVPTSSS